MVWIQKFLFVCLLGSAWGYCEDLARKIAQRINTRGYADFMAGRMLDCGARTDDLAAFSENLYRTVLTPTTKYLSRHATPWDILSQIDGVSLTINSHKATTCTRHYSDHPQPCYELVNAFATWVNAELCSRFYLGLDPIDASDYGVCVDWMNPA